MKATTRTLSSSSASKHGAYKAPAAYSPAYSSTPVSPVTSTPVSPSETLQSRRVSRIIHLHPTLRCNLTCQHCYSSSGPGRQPRLAPKPLIHFLEQATTLGYDTVNFSGGEPFLYKHLEQLAVTSASLGYLNAVTTNGMFLRGAASRRLLRSFDSVTISVDGKEKTHDKMRGQQGAFAAMLKGLPVLKDEVKNYGFVHTILPDSWLIFPWLAEFALLHKAQWLRLHPIELSGRAAGAFSSLKFSDMDLYRIYISHYYLKTYFEPELSIQLDLLHRDSLQNNPGLVFPDAPSPTGIGTNTGHFSSLFNELVVNERGDLLPLSHGFSPSFRIGNINSGLPLEMMIDRYMAERFSAIAHLRQLTYQSLLSDPDVDIFNWNEKLTEKSHEL